MIFVPMVGAMAMTVPGCTPGCEHDWKSKQSYSTRTRNSRSKDAFQEAGPENIERLKKSRWTEHEWCTRCGGWRGGLGSEPTTEMYVAHMVLVCREIARVLRPDGVFWLNIADSYSGSGGAGGDYLVGGTREGEPKYPGRKISGLQDGDMLMIPQRLALALQADGWIVRRDVIWDKNAMPEPRKGWRYEKPPCTCVSEQREAFIKKQMDEQGIDRHRIFEKAGTAFTPDPNCPRCLGTGRLVNESDRFTPESWRHTASHEYVWMLSRNMHYYSDHTRIANETGSNPRDVVRPARTNYSGKHFAVFPPQLIAPLISATVPLKACGDCGKPWAPVLEVVGHGSANRSAASQDHLQPKDRRPVSSVGRGNRTPGVGKYKTKTNQTGYRPTCDCDTADNYPGWVLDPFMGSGTTGLVARELGVSFVGVDISFEYLDGQAKIRSKTGMPSKQFDNLPLLEVLDEKS